MAEAGLQDLFLETLWWGKEASSTGSFPQHFPGTDFLAQALPVASRYGVRIHAVCETGLLDFGSTPSALLQQNPGWVVANRNPAITLTGDQVNERYVNLGNPAVVAKLSSYVAALMTRYPGLAGVQFDDNFFPNASSNTAPWSFDAWARSAYQAKYGVDPVNDVNLAASTFPQRWLDWSRGNVTSALVALRAAADGVSTTPLISAVGIADGDLAAYRARMLDLNGWAVRNGAEAYTTSSAFTGSNALTLISNDLLKAQTVVPGRRIIAGLSIRTDATRPALVDQLATIKSRGVEEFCITDASALAAADAATRSGVRSWIATNASKQRGDINSDGFIDARDVALFDALYQGVRIAVTPQNARYNLDDNSQIDATDRVMLIREFNRFRFGEDGVIDAADIASLRAAYVAGGAPDPNMPLALFDLNGDGSVDYADELILNGRLTVLGPIDADVNRDGLVDIEDLYYENQHLSVDVNRDGVINGADIGALEEYVQFLQQ